tara:strand:- start:9643 stop:10230 length:588 start_codon:yes stop_codon:yes gene_type:complete
MALGFIVAGVTTRKIIPDKTLTKNSTPRLRIQRFGDGYEQRVVDGINNINQTYSSSFTNREKEEADDIIAFFDTQGAVTAFDFVIPDSNSTSTTTSVTNSSSSSSTSVTLTTLNTDITPDATVSGSGISGTPTVSSIDGADLVLSSAQSISGGVILTFTNPNELKIKVVCDSWTISYTNKAFYNIQANFRRVFEP